MQVQHRLEKLIQNISQDFSLDKLSKSPARFNLQKLSWFNREYIKLLSLQEFCLRASKNKIQISPGLNYKNQDLRFRTGDYLLFVDLEKQKVLCIKDPEGSIAFGGRYYLIGGGRKEGEDFIDNLKREIDEETQGKVLVDEIKIIKICNYKAYSPFDYPGEGHYDGRDIHVYFYPLKMEEMSSFTLIDGGSHQVDWYDLASFLENNNYLNYPIWQDFCSQNNLILLPQTEEIKNQYLAWLLDKNRVTTLSEFGTESEVVLKYIPPSKDEIKWKKSTAEESVTNLNEIAVYIKKLLSEPETVKLKNELKDSIFTDSVDSAFEKCVEYFETNLKNWLTENSKSVGDYLWPLRVCLSGKQKSPSPFELLSVMSLEQIQLRLDEFKV